MQISKTERKTKYVGIRVTETLLNKTTTMADLYADGDLSEWVRHCLENYEPKMIKKKKKKKRAAK